LTGGFVGYLAYDAVRYIERLPEKAVDELGFPDLTMLLVTDLAAVDHHECTVVLIANALVHPDMSASELDSAYADAMSRLDAMSESLAAPSPSTVGRLSAAPPKQANSRTPAGDYEPAVEQALEAVRAGEVFQIQIGQRFTVETEADSLDVYRVLRTLNPSPYMYYVRLADFDIVGCSPEALVTVNSGKAVLHPIAGTRKRGDTAERDAALAAELVNDPKEQAEHIMLVDLARNDLGRVSAAGSVEVVEFGAVERYSHVWHIVSTVTSDVADGKDAFDVLTATFPAGTLTGAPKVRAMELIDELEPVRRGVYGGAVGYLDAAGDLDMAIAIRTAVMKDGIAYVQASAGIVADSIPANEEGETRSKARAVLQAIATAETLTQP
jgi:anthranilate synthase component 1